LKGEAEKSLAVGGGSHIVEKSLKRYDKMERNPEGGSQKGQESRHRLEKA